MPYGGNIHATVSADLVQTDVDSIVQGLAGSPGKTLADVQAPLAGVLECLLGTRPGALTGINDTLAGALIDEWDAPWLMTISNFLGTTLINADQGYESWMATINRAIGDMGQIYLFDQAWQLPTLAVIHTELVNELFDQVNIQPFLQTIKYDLQSGLFDPMHGASWLESLYYMASSGLFDNVGEPWFSTIRYSLDNYLYDWANSRSLMEALDSRLASLLAILDDVYDSTQHALRTV